MGLVTAVVLGLLASQGAHAQDVSYPSTYPQNYTGIPKGGYGPDWQKCTSAHRLPTSPSLLMEILTPRLSSHATSPERDLRYGEKLGREHRRGSPRVFERHTLLLGIRAGERLSDGRGR
jgi:hypothetical protein